MNKKIIFIRHGESIWNKLNQFTGWEDVDLSKKGEIEAFQSANLLIKNKFIFDIAYTSVLKRAIHSLWIILKNMNQSWLPVIKTWKLNERHYGALQGLNKNTTILKYGEEKVRLWRRSFNSIPPKIKEFNASFLKNNLQYSNIHINKLPLSESLECTQNRVIPFWNNVIMKEFKKNKRILIVAHGNSLRALIKYLSNISDKDIENLNIPTGKPFSYEFDEHFVPIKYHFLESNENV